MDISGLGYQTINALIEKGWVQDVGDLYFLTGDQLARVEGFGKKSVDNLLNALEKSKQQPLSSVLVALGIRHLGTTGAHLVADAVASLEDLESVTEEQLSAIEGVGPVIALSIAEFFREPRNQEVLHKLRRAGINPVGRPQPRQGPFLGKTFVLTGTLEHFTRSAAIAALEDRGGKVVTSVSKKTDFVVVGADPGSKFAKAQTIGVQTVSESELQQLLDGN